MKLICVLVFFCLIRTQVVRAEEFPTIEQLADILRDQRADVRDYECMYEGKQVRRTTPDTSSMEESIRLATEKDPVMRAGFNKTYQGVFAFRFDSSVGQDISTITSDPQQAKVRSVQTLFRGKASARTIIPDRGGVVGPDVTKKSNLIFITNNSITLMFIDLNPILRETLAFREGLEYSNVAWEDVDGFRCLAFDLGRRYGEDPPSLVERYWVDLAHNALVRQLERTSAGFVASRLGGIKIAEVRTLDGKAVWLPVGGKIQWYEADKSPRTVYLEGSFDILDGSLRINQGLKDERFTLDYGVDARDIAVAREYNSGKRRPKNTGPTPAAQALANVIKDVNDPSKRFVAEPDQSGWFGRFAGIISVSLGVIVLIAGGVLRVRSR